MPAAPPRPVERPSLRGADPKAEYDAAMDQLARAQYGAAQESFRAFAEAHPDDTLAPQALYWFGDIAYSTQKNYADAARAFAELLKKYAKAPRAPDAMVRLGESLINLGQKKEGCATLAALDAKYPNAAAAVSTRARTQRKAAKCA